MRAPLWDTGTGGGKGWKGRKAKTVHSGRKRGNESAAMGYWNRRRERQEGKNSAFWQEERK